MQYQPTRKNLIRFQVAKHAGTGFVSIAVVMAAIAVWWLVRPPANAQEAGYSLGKALIANDEGTLQGMLWKKESQSLHMSDSQVSAVLRYVFCPAFKKLKIDVDKLRPVGGGYDWYAITDGHVSGVRVNVVLGLIQLKPNQFSTTLTNLFLGLDQAEFQAARKLGREAEFTQNRQERIRDLIRYGMPGLCDVRNFSVTLWR